MTEIRDDAPGVPRGGGTRRRYRGGRTCHTGRFFFPGSSTDRIARIAPYSGRGVRRVRNSEDAIHVNQGGRSSLLRLAADRRARAGRHRGDHRRSGSRRDPAAEGF